MMLFKFSFACFLWVIMLQITQAQVAIHHKKLNYEWTLSEPEGVKMTFSCQYPVLDFYNFTRNPMFPDKVQERLKQELQTQILTLPFCLNSKRHEHLQAFADGIFEVAKNTSLESQWTVQLDTLAGNLWQIRRSLVMEGEVFGASKKGGAMDAIWLDSRGKKLELKDVLEDIEIEKIRKLLVSKLKTKFNLKESQNIEELFWVSDTTFFMPTIFWIEKDKFHFYFCKKEIAPQEQGDIWLIISREELVALLPKEHRILSILKS